MIFKKSSDLNVSLVQDMLGVSFHNMRNAARFPFGIPTAPIKSDRQVTPGELLVVDTTDGDVNLFLPRISGHFIGKTLFIKRVDNSTNNVILHSGPNDLINGETTQQITHILGTAAVTAITPTDWFVKFATLQYEADAIEPVTYTKYYYALDSDKLVLKIDDGDWNEVTLPGSPVSLYDIRGSSSDNVWVCGASDTSEVLGYIATNRSGEWVEVTQSELIIVDNPWRIRKLIVEENRTWIIAQRNADSGLVVRIYNWTPAGGWVLNSATSDSYCWATSSFAKSGLTVMATGEDQILFHSQTYGTLEWGKTTAGTNNPQDMAIFADPLTDETFYKIESTGGGINMEKGGPFLGGGWQSFGTYGSGSADIAHNLFHRLWVDEIGNPYVVTSSPTPGLVYNWADTPTLVPTGATTLWALDGIDQNEICWLEDQTPVMFRSWNGSSLSTAEDTGLSEKIALWCIKEEN